MNTQRNTPTPDFRTRLIALLVVLAVGFVMGWVNGRSGGASDPTATGIVSSESKASEGEDATADNAGAQDPDSDNGSGEQAAQDATSDDGSSTVAPTRGPTVEEDGWYTSKEEVALYIHTFGHLPDNFISKTKARDRGWVASEGNLDEVCPGMSIGGSRYYDDDGQLPYRSKRRWTECDINYEGGYRGAERIVFSNDGLIFYTDDHYETFEQLY